MVDCSVCICAFFLIALPRDLVDRVKQICRMSNRLTDLAVKIDLVTAAAAYAWVNARPAWGAGYANLATGKIHIDAYLH